MMTRRVSQHVGAIKWTKCFSVLIIYIQVHKLVYENNWKIVYSFGTKYGRYTSSHYHCVWITDVSTFKHYIYYIKVMWLAVTSGTVFPVEMWLHCVQRRKSNWTLIVRFEVPAACDSECLFFHSILKEYTAFIFRSQGSFSGTHWCLKMKLLESIETWGISFNLNLFAIDESKTG
jgi:hypothetical protein